MTHPTKRSRPTPFDSMNIGQGEDQHTLVNRYLLTPQATYALDVVLLESSRGGST
jgi:hypothetical protein